jgi:hypothetical protein
MHTILNTNKNWFVIYIGRGSQSKLKEWIPTPENIKSLSVGNTFHLSFNSQVYAERLITGPGTFIEYKEMAIASVWNEFGRKSIWNLKKKFIQNLQNSLYNENAVTVEKLNVNEYKVGCIILTEFKFRGINKVFKKALKRLRLIYNHNGELYLILCK